MKFYFCFIITLFIHLICPNILTWIQCEDMSTVTTYCRWNACVSLMYGCVIKSYNWYTVNNYFQKLFICNSHLSSFHTLLLRYAAQFMHKKGGKCMRVQLLLHYITMHKIYREQKDCTQTVCFTSFTTVCNIFKV